MKIVITGANGFIGSNLCNYLSLDNEILAVSRNNNNIQDNQKIQFLKCDLKTISNYEKEILDFDPDILIHCAWIGGNNFQDTSSIIQFENVVYGIQLLDIIKKSKIKLFIGLGTSVEYGYYSSPVKECHIPNPYSLYGQSKKYFYDICKNICESENIDFTWVLPFYLYGPNDVKSRLIPKVIDSSLKNNDLFLNSCDSLVDYLYIDDFVSGVDKIIKYNLLGKVNLSSGKTYNIKYIIEYINNICNYTGVAVFDKNKDRPNYQKYFCGDNSKIKNLTDWKENFSLEQGLKKTIERYKDVTRF
jgi:nucleoside-diphosphate-sugar epimerase